MKDSALYIHIPFCDHKCIYCDFYSIITSDNIDPFLNSLKKEIESYASLYSDERIFSSIFFGGGTPSLMTPGYIEDIIKSLKQNFKINDNPEITLETNPGTVDNKKLELFLAAGINRISVGIQSFDDKDLKFLTRIHDKETAVNTIFNASKAGFDNISIDLIFNLPGQTKEKWLKNLETAVKLPVNHISAYSLILERGTILNKLVLDGKVEIQDEDYDAELYEITIDFLSSEGFIQYEVSNFAKPGFECLHNKAYWQYRDYLSFGPSAHSFAAGKRWWNFSSLKRYITEIEKTGKAVAGFELLNDEQKFDEYIMLAMRSGGLDIGEMKYMYKGKGQSWLNDNDAYLKILFEQNLIKRDSDKISLTKTGYAVCDEILSKLL
ncbi:MAG: radical SAM family heme chaperone HemW [Ignavibacteriaceae bacterium]